jgi:hypothetical protein
MLNAGVLLIDVAGVIAPATSADEIYFNGGTPTNAVGTLIIADTEPVHFQGGLGYSADGALCVDPFSEISHYSAGLPLSEDGLVAVSFGGEPVSTVAGIPLDLDGRVCLAELPT